MIPPRNKDSATWSFPGAVCVAGVLLLMLLQGGCRFDDDSAYYPFTQKAFLLITDSLSTDKQLIRIENETITPHWEQQLGINGTLTAIGSYENTCWIASALPNEVHLADPENNQLLQSFSTDDLRPDFICAGDQYVLVSDSAAHRIGFLHRKKGTLTTIDLTDAPSRAVYRSRKFYLQLGARTVAIFREEALATLGEVAFERTIEDLQVDNLISIQVFTRDTALYQASIDYNTNALSVAERLETADQVQVSPIRVASYGKEWLGRVAMQDSRLSQGGFTEVTDFETDFFESTIYYVARDSLFRYRIATDDNQPFGPLIGEIQNSFFFQAVFAD